MSITKETLEQHLKDPAIFCCRREKGTVIGAADLEDPSLFDDMVEAGLLTLSDDGLTIEEVLGSTLLEDTEALTPITRDVLDKVNEVRKTAPSGSAPVPKQAVTHVTTSTAGGNGMIHLDIENLKVFPLIFLWVPLSAFPV